MNSSTAKASLPKSMDWTLLLGLFEQMIRLRRFELATQEKCKTGEMTFVHLCIGEEATAVGVCAAQFMARLKQILELVDEFLK